jgi:hypothetical protein
MAAGRKRLGKHIPVAADVHVTIEKFLETLFSAWSVQIGYIMRTQARKYRRLKLGGGEAYDRSGD